MFVGFLRNFAQIKKYERCDLVFKVTCPYCGAEAELDPVQRHEPTLYASDYLCPKCKQRFSAFFYCADALKETETK